MKAWHPDSTWRPVNDEMVKQALELVLDARNHPLLLTCASGIYESGYVLQNLP
jgi:tyrosine-protein phosphatase SIW14